MLQRVVRQDGQFGGYADTVVGSQSGTFGSQPFTFDYGFYRVGEEIVLHVVVLLAYHIYMRLQDYRLPVLHTRCGGFLDQYIPGFVDQSLQILFFTECFQVSNHFLFLL